MALRLKGCSRCGGDLYEDAWDPGTWWCIQCARMYLDNPPPYPELHIPKRFRSLMKTHGQQVVEMYVDDQLSINQICKQTGLDYDRVAHILITAGIPFRSRSEQMKLTLTQKKERGDVNKWRPQTTNVAFNPSHIRERAGP